MMSSVLHLNFCHHFQVTLRTKALYFQQIVKYINHCYNVYKKRVSRPKSYHYTINKVGHIYLYYRWLYCVVCVGSRRPMIYPIWAYLTVRIFVNFRWLRSHCTRGLNLRCLYLLHFRWIRFCSELRSTEKFKNSCGKQFGDNLRETKKWLPMQSGIPHIVWFYCTIDIPRVNRRFARVE